MALTHLALKSFACAGVMERSGEEHMSFHNQHGHVVGESYLLSLKSMHLGVKYMREVLGLMPLHTEPLPINMRRLIMDFGATEHSFCHHIIRHVYSTSVFMCITLGSKPSVPITSPAEESI